MVLRCIRAIVAVVFVVLGLAGCGGGSDSPKGEVTVYLSYAGAPSGRVGVAYYYAPNYNSSQDISEHFELAGGSLPPGLGISAGDGVISGVPSTVGTYSFTIRLTAKNVKGEVFASGVIMISNDMTMSITFNPPTGVVGQAYSYTPTWSSNKSVTPSFSASGLPPGLSINSSTGEITGTPSIAGNYYYASITLNAGGSSYLNSSSMVILSSGSSASSSFWASSWSSGSSLSSVSSSATSSTYGSSSSVSSYYGSSSSAASSSIMSSSSSSTPAFPVSSGTAACSTASPQGSIVATHESSRSVSLPSFSAVVYDKGRRLYYAAISANASSQAGRIAIIPADPGSVSYSTATFAGDISALAISADCSTLYAGTNSAELVRIALPGLTEDARVKVSHAIESLSVSPASAETVVATFANYAYSPHYAGSALFLTMARQPVPPTGSFINKVAFDPTSDGSHVFGYESEVSSFTLSKLKVLGNGLQTSITTGTSAGYNRTPDVRDGIISLNASFYSTTNLALLGSLPGYTNCRKLPQVSKVVCLYNPLGDYSSYLGIADSSSFGVIAVPNIGSSDAWYGTLPGPTGQIALIRSSGLKLYHNLWLQ